MAVNTRDLDLAPILAVLEEVWPEPWRTATRTRGAFHGVAMLDEVVARVSVGTGHRDRAAAEVANHEAFAGIGVPMRSPRAIRAPYSTSDWTAVAYDRIPGEPVPEELPWSQARTILLPVLEALRAVRVERATGLRPVREWCGGAEWPARVTEVTRGLDEALRGLADRLVAAVLDTEADAPTGLVHGDFTPYNLLRDGDAVALIDLDFAAVGDPAINLTWISTSYPTEELLRDLTASELERGRLHRAAGPLQIATAAHAGGNEPLERHALSRFEDNAPSIAALLAD